MFYPNVANVLLIIFFYNIPFILIITFYTYFMYFVYFKKNIIIPRYMYTYSCTAPPNGYYLDLWRCINVLIIIIPAEINVVSPPGG